MQYDVQHIADFEKLAPLIIEWKALSPAMGILVLLPEAEASKVSTIQSICDESGVPMVGALFPSIIVGSSFVTNGASVVRFNRMPDYFLQTALNSSEALSSKAISTTIDHLLAKDKAAHQKSLFMIFDGMLPNIESILTEIHAKIGDRVTYSGVNAGSETFQSVPCVFDTQRFISNAVMGLVLPKNADVFLEHGYLTSKPILSATSSEGNRVDFISNRPAFDAYQEVVKEEYGILLTRENFLDYAAHFPFGVRSVSDVLVRIPVCFTDEGSLFFIGEIPPHSSLALLKAPIIEESRCIENLAQRINLADNNKKNNALLLFYCAGRRLHFGDGAVKEIEQLKDATGCSNLFGALTLGEIDTIQEFGIPRFHNAAIVCVA